MGARVQGEQMRGSQGPGTGCREYGLGPRSSPPLAPVGSESSLREKAALQAPVSSTLNWVENVTNFIGLF